MIPRAHYNAICVAASLAHRAAAALSPLSCRTEPVESCYANVAVGINGAALAQRDRNERANMRLIFGFVLGVAATIGGAYWHDMAIPDAPGTSKRLVNWDAAGEFARWTVERARDEWDKLTTK